MAKRIDPERAAVIAGKKQRIRALLENLAKRRPVMVTDGPLTKK
jgi:hypothetical protein